ncbi:hypothetical protein R5W23_006012 [Gemmata sp. JC673]|uniref:Uncharacterized protein n=1 Tax=Gemmata algarum TaxID=2975278 RepID=A0ABU5ETY4_9BACT|nr:hypothetical protein [Gemmata algarum]MDY3557912.1 hypothetical protein [Gemmata algarum]
MRTRLGFDGAPKMSFHLTLGRLVFAQTSTKGADPEGWLVL